MDCLTIDQLQQVLTNKELVTWHPDYSCPHPEPPFFIKYIEDQIDCYSITLKSTEGITEIRNIRKDGYGYTSGKPMFILAIQPVTRLNITISELPRNNDGRTDCAFCGAPTRKAGGGVYDICTKCGK